MSVEPVGLVVVMLGALAFLRPPGFGFTVLVVLTLLGAAAAVLLGGAGTVQPAHLMLGFLALASLGRLDWTAARRSLRFPGAGFWLAAFTLVAVTSAVFMPRLLARSTDINAIGSTDYGPSLFLVPLGPTSGNITQSIYVVADFVCFVLCVAFAGRPDGFRTLARALAAYCIGNVVFAFLDLATFWTGTSYLLAPIRNADYDLHIETIEVGMKRIVGSFVEASSFAGTTLTTVAFSASLALAGIRPRVFGAVALVSLVLLALSTSSTAYVAGSGLLVVLYVGVVRRAMQTRAPALNFGVLLLAPAAVAALLGGIMLTPRASAAVGDVLQTMLVDKAGSESGLARAAWNTTALGNVADTYGLGTGLGSVRASSFPVAVLANTGVVGAALMTAFLVAVLCGVGRPARASRSVAAVRSAARVACLATLMGATVAGTMVDLGLTFFAFAALACAPAARDGPATPGADRLSPSLPST